MRALLAASALGAALVLLYAAWNRRRLLLGFLAVALVLAVAWALALVAMSTDFRDADGWVDCWPACSLLQDAVGAALVGAPVVLVLSALFATALAALTFRRGRRRRRHG